MQSNPIPFLRIITLIEGVSFLILLGIAMPLKYFAGRPGAVTVVGWIHGILFIIFFVALVRVMFIARWPLMRGLLVFIAALLPFGPFLIDRKMGVYQAQFDKKLSGG